MDKKVLWLRISYWTGAAIDALAAIQMLFPSIFALVNKPVGFQPGADYRYAMGTGASLMLGWTALLIWADRRPVERKGVLLITVFPAIFGLVVNEARAVSAGFIEVGAAAPIWALQAALVALFIFSYLNAGSTSSGG